MVYSLYIVEDEPVTLDLCVEYLRVALPEYRVVGSAREGRVAVDACLALRPDLIIVDIQLPDMSGLELLLTFKRELPDSKVLIFSATDCPEVVKAAWAAQADGFIQKRSGLNEIRMAVDAIMAGKPYFAPAVAAKIVELTTRGRTPRA